MDIFFSVNVIEKLFIMGLVGWFCNVLFEITLPLSASVKEPNSY